MGGRAEPIGGEAGRQDVLDLEVSDQSQRVLVEDGLGRLILGAELQVAVVDTGAVGLGGLAREPPPRGGATSKAGRDGVVAGMDDELRGCRC